MTYTFTSAPRTTAGGRHVWIDTSLGFPVRKPFGVAVRAIRSQMRQEAHEEAVEEVRRLPWLKRLWLRVRLWQAKRELRKLKKP